MLPRDLLFDIPRTGISCISDYWNVGGYQSSSSCQSITGWQSGSSIPSFLWAVPLPPGPVGGVSLTRAIIPSYKSCLAVVNFSYVHQLAVANSIHGSGWGMSAGNCLHSPSGCVDSHAWARGAFLEGVKNFPMEVLLSSLLTSASPR